MEVESKDFGDEMAVYAETSTGVDIQEYPSFDLGLKSGGLQPHNVLRLDTDGNQDKGDYTDLTSEARSLSGSTLLAIRLADVQYDALYIMFPKKFCGVQVNIQTAGIDAGTLVATWEYPTTVDDNEEPSAWLDLTENDGSASAAGKGLDSGTGLKQVKWAIASDWVESKINGVKGYWVKFMVSTGGYSTAPVLESIEIVLPIPGMGIIVPDSVNDACSLYINSRLSAGGGGGGEHTKGDAIPIVSGKAFSDDKIKVYNFLIVDLADTKVMTVITKGRIGDHE